MEKALTENQLHYLVRSKLRIILEKSAVGSYPEEDYQPMTRKNMYLDKLTRIGRWPEGEYDPPTQDCLVKWYQDMSTMSTTED
jgi:hypothetical protein